MNIIHLNNFSYLEIDNMPSAFSYGKYYLFKYIENGIELSSFNVDSHTFISIFYSFFSLQNFVEQDKEWETSIAIPPSNILKDNSNKIIIIHREANSDYISFIIKTINSIDNKSYDLEINIDNGYIGRISNILEDILVNNDNYDDKM